MKRPKGNKKSILMQLPETEEENQGEEPEIDEKLSEDDIFSVKPILLEETSSRRNTEVETKDLIEPSSTRGEEVETELTPTPTPTPPPVKSKKIRSEKQLKVLEKARQKRKENLEKKKQYNKDERDTVNQSSSVGYDTPNNNKHSPSPKSSSNNDFESFLSNYQKMKQFENFVLEQNRNLLEETSSQRNKVVPETKPQTKPQNLLEETSSRRNPQSKPQNTSSERNLSSMAFNLKRRSRRGGFY